MTNEASKIAENLEYTLSSFEKRHQAERNVQKLLETTLENVVMDFEMFGKRLESIIVLTQTMPQDVTLADLVTLTRQIEMMTHESRQYPAVRRIIEGAEFWKNNRLQELANRE